MTRAALASVLAWLALASSARAQGCAAGRIETIEGYCCWPAQTWSAEHQRCEGPPMCPSGMAAEGDECVGLPAASSPPATTADGATVTAPPRYGGGDVLPGFGPPAPAPQAWTPSAPPAPPPIDLSSARAGSAWPETTRAPGATNPHREAQLDVALFGAGVGLVIAGYVVSIGESVAAFDSRGIPTDSLGWDQLDSTCHDAAGGLFLVPIVGALLGAITHASCSVPLYTEYIGVRFRSDQSRGAWGEAGYAGFAVLASALQIAGGIMAIVGLTVPRTVLVFDGGPTATLSIAPHGSPQSVGLDLRLGWL